MPIITSKPPKITTTVRLDAALKKRAEAYAKRHHMDFSKFLHVALQQSLQTGIQTEPEWNVSPAFAQQLLEQDERIARGEEKMYGPFEGKAAIEYLESLY